MLITLRLHVDEGQEAPFCCAFILGAKQTAFRFCPVTMAAWKNSFHFTETNVMFASLNYHDVSCIIIIIIIKLLSDNLCCVFIIVAPD